MIGTPFGWVRNLRTGEPVETRHLGRRRPADVRVYRDEPDGRKRRGSARLFDPSGALLSDASALFLQLQPGQA